MKMIARASAPRRRSISAARRAAAQSTATRDPARVARDVQLGYVTPEAARRDYKARA